jgi:hypothetical protein
MRYAARALRWAARSSPRAAPKRRSDASGSTEPMRIRSSSSKTGVARASTRRPAGVSSMMEDRRSSGLARRLQYPAASTRSTTLLAPPTVIENSDARSCTRHDGPGENLQDLKPGELLLGAPWNDMTTGVDGGSGRHRQHRPAHRGGRQRRDSATTRSGRQRRDSATTRSGRSRLEPAVSAALAAGYRHLDTARHTATRKCEPAWWLQISHHIARPPSFAVPLSGWRALLRPLSAADCCPNRMHPMATLTGRGIP